MQNGNGADSFQNKAGYEPQPHGGGKRDMESGNAVISSLFTPFFRKRHRWALYQRHHYDRSMLSHRVELSRFV